jgi:hypothetical protein
MNEGYVLPWAPSVNEKKMKMTKGALLEEGGETKDVCVFGETRETVVMKAELSKMV